jgi:predicted flap endonuclease-1-like 5' DNA nuclease
MSRIVYVNGAYLPEEEAKISVFDRGFLFADGVYYVFVWYGTLLAADGVVALVGGAGERGRFLLLDRPAHLLSMLGWSAVVWLFYEAFNFRLRNWYYINLPNDVVSRWVGVVVSFATVLPAVFLSQALLEGLGVAKRVRWKRLRVTPALLVGLQVAGVAVVALVLVWPRYLFPLVWGATTLIVEPAVYRKDPGRSLLGDLENGSPGRLLRLLLGGAAIGFLWEMYNIRAVVKWIYTVPGLEDVKLFEMPVLGFLGFPPFAVECFVLWQALVVAGVAIPRDAARVARASVRRRIVLVGAAVLMSALVIREMEIRTVSSRMPRLSDMTDAPAVRLENAGYDMFSLAAARPESVATALDLEPGAARRWVERARLATLRGIGITHLRELERAGISSVAQLAAADPAAITVAIERNSGKDPGAARVRVWVRAARRAAAAD